MSAAQLNLPIERIATGTIPGMSLVSLRGRNAAISSSQLTVWGVGSNYASIGSAQSFEAVSSSVNDTAAGTGARTISVDLVDSDYVQTTQTITMNGTTAVAISGTYVACNRIEVLTTGSGTVNAGSIDIRFAGAGSIRRRMTATTHFGYGKDWSFFYTIPAGYKGLLRNTSFTTQGATTEIMAALYTTDLSGSQLHIGTAIAGLSAVGINPGYAQFLLGNGILINEKTFIDMKVECTGVGTGDFQAMGELLLMKSGIANGMGF